MLILVGVFTNPADFKMQKNSCNRAANVWKDRSIADNDVCFMNPYLSRVRNVAI
jgi:hypothetical protein